MVIRKETEGQGTKQGPASEKLVDILKKPKIDMGYLHHLKRLQQQRWSATTKGQQITDVTNPGSHEIPKNHRNPRDEIVMQGIESQRGGVSDGFSDTSSHDTKGENLVIDLDCRDGEPMDLKNDFQLDGTHPVHFKEAGSVRDSKGPVMIHQMPVKPSSELLKQKYAPEQVLHFQGNVKTHLLRVPSTSKFLSHSNNLSPTLPGNVRLSAQSSHVSAQRSHVSAQRSHISPPTTTRVPCSNAGVSSQITSLEKVKAFAHYKRKVTNDFAFSQASTSSDNLDRFFSSSETESKSSIAETESAKFGLGVYDFGDDMTGKNKTKTKFSESKVERDNFKVEEIVPSDSNSESKPFTTHRKIKREMMSQYHSANYQNRSNGRKRKEYRCRICFKVFNQRSNLLHHHVIHTGKRSFECTICKKAFKQKGHLSSHMRIHSGIKPYSCTFCGKSFVDKSNMKMHLVTHTGQRSHECKVCHKSFKQKAHLQGHMISHAKVKPYSCDICGINMTQRSNLKKHLLLHSGERPFLCSFPNCNKSFTQKGHLVGHLASHQKREEERIKRLMEKALNQNEDGSSVVSEFSSGENGDEILASSENESRDMEPTQLQKAKVRDLMKVAAKCESLSDIAADCFEGQKDKKSGLT